MKKLFCAALILATASVLASCGGGGKKDAGGFRPALDTKTACDLKVIGSYDNFEALGAEAERFKEYYPNVRVLYTKLDGSYNDNIISFLEGSEKPNVFFSYTWMMGNEKYSSVVGHMEDLSDPALKMDLNCIRPNLLSKDDQGKSYMVPVFSRTYGMLVNEDLFKKENIQIMHKELTENEYTDAWLDGQGNVYIGEDPFPVKTEKAIEGGVLTEEGYVLDPKTGKKYNLKDADVVATVPLDKIQLSDDLSAGHAQGTIINLVWIGDHYQYIVRTDDDEDYVVNSPYAWNENDLVSIEIAPEDIALRVKGGLDGYRVEE